MKIMITAAAIALAPMAALAQDTEMMDPAAMQESFTMLESNVANILSTYGIDASVQELTVGQMAQIIGLANSTDAESEIGERIEAIVAN